MKARLREVYQEDEWVTFLLLALSSLCMVYTHWIPRQVCGGMLLLSGIVVHKNRLRQQALEEQCMAGSEEALAALP